ncbi:MAG TPA: hypothetical protein VGU74_14020 [Gemmatimonadales bacterium]|nr:hypothetical protein [Gemmatimonadales bacterium]
MNSNIDLIYFWSSLVLVALPLIVFGGLTYWVIKTYRKEHAAASTEQKTSP